MPAIQVYLHFVWSTKLRTPFFCTPEIRHKTWVHIIENGLKTNIYMIRVNGFNDHCHCLLKLRHHQTIAKIMNQLKGESSHWINQTGLTKEYSSSLKFSWQPEYYVDSVSSSSLARLIKYLDNQEQHHTVHPMEKRYILPERIII